MVFDLLVVGNGLAAQTFLFEFLKKMDVNKSQNFSVANIYSEDIAHSCSLRTTAHVSLSGIEEGISDLGNDLRESFFLFEKFCKDYNPDGVEKVKQVISSSTLEEKEKMLRRYKNLEEIRHPILNESVIGVELDSYIIGPSLLNSWFDKQLSSSSSFIMKKKNFVTKVSKNSEGLIECFLLNNEVIRAKKIILCTGAYAKLFSSFFIDTGKILEKTQIVPGTFLERRINLAQPSFFVTIDGYNIIYRHQEQVLILGSVSSKGNVVMTDYQKLSEILLLFNEKCNFSLGILSDFKKITGIRHRGIKRRPIAGALNNDKSIYMINGFYKNGFTFSHLCAKKVLTEINP